jgi:hypothetical protein
MDRASFVHVIQAAAAVVEDELVVVGSQAVLAHIERPPEAMVRSAEVDVYPRSDPDRAIEIDKHIGDSSRFHETHGYFAHGVGPETITAPAGWEGRLLRFEVPPIRRKDRNAVAYCLSLPDLMLAKLAAGRPHDVEFVEEALRSELVDAGDLRRGVDLMPKAHQAHVRTRLEGLAAKLTRSE